MAGLSHARHSTPSLLLLLTSPSHTAGAEPQRSSATAPLPATCSSNCAPFSDSAYPKLHLDVLRRVRPLTAAVDEVRGRIGRPPPICHGQSSPSSRSAPVTKLCSLFLLPPSCISSALIPRSSSVPCHDPLWPKTPQRNGAVPPHRHSRWRAHTGELWAPFSS
jgi:hypothetical protein